MLTVNQFIFFIPHFYNYFFIGPFIGQLNKNMSVGGTVLYLVAKSKVGDQTENSKFCLPRNIATELKKHIKIELYSVLCISDQILHSGNIILSSYRSLAVLFLVDFPHFPLFPLENVSLKFWNGRNKLFSHSY